MRKINPARLPATTLHNITKTYGRGKSATHALNSINLDIRQGEVTSILGPNGAGKTTAIKLMLGLLQPTSGEVSLFGSKPHDPVARVRTGAMMQIAGLPDTLRVEELVRLFSSYYPAPLALDRILDIAGLWEVRSRVFGKLSGGQKQRVMFALAVCGDPDLLFLDEPTVGLDIETRRSFWAQIRRFIARGKTIILTTHYLEEADALSDRIVLIDKGEVKADGTPHEIKATTSTRCVSCITSIAAQTALEHPAVQDARVNRARLEIATSEAEAVVRHLLDLDPNLRDLEIVGAGIDEAFLQLTHDEAPNHSDLVS